MNAAALKSSRMGSTTYAAKGKTYLGRNIIVATFLNANTVGKWKFTITGFSAIDDERLLPIDAAV
jgi:hypothetical protein